MKNKFAMKEGIMAGADKYIYTISKAAFADGDSFWIAPCNCNSILECSIKEKRVCNIYGIEEPFKEYMFSKIVKVEDSLIFVPYNAADMWVMNIETKVLKKANIGLNEEERLLAEKFTIAISFEAKLFLFGTSISGIIVYDPITDCATRISLGDCEIQNKGGRQFCNSYTVVNEKAFVPFYDTNTILQFDLHKQTIQKKEIKDLPNQYYSFMTNEDGTLCLYDCNDNKYSIDYQTGNVVSVDAVRLLDDGVYKGYDSIVGLEECSLFIPSMFSTIYFVKKGGKNIEKTRLDDKKLNGVGEGRYTRYEFICLLEKNILIQSRIDGEVYNIEKNTHRISSFYFEIDDAILHTIEKKILLNTSSITQFENNAISLSTFIDELV